MEENKPKCPEEGCLFWGKKGQVIAPGHYDNLDSAQQNLRPLEHDGCWHYERCTREFDDGTDDYFENTGESNGS